MPILRASASDNTRYLRANASTVVGKTTQANRSVTNNTTAAVTKTSEVRLTTISSKIAPRTSLLATVLQKSPGAGKSKL